MKTWLQRLALLLGTAPMVAMAVPDPIPEIESTPACEHSVETARAQLSMIYSSERAFQAEYDSFTDGFFEIGYDPAESEECDAKNWSFSIDPSANAKSFVAHAKSRRNGQVVSINEQKKITVTK